jgi:hypothetical protein
MRQTDKTVTNVKSFKLSIANASKNMTVYQFGSLLGYHSDHVENILNGATKDTENFLIRWHQWDLMAKAIARVDSDTLVKILSIYG